MKTLMRGSRSWLTRQHGPWLWLWMIAAPPTVARGASEPAADAVSAAEAALAAPLATSLNADQPPAAVLAVPVAASVEVPLPGTAYRLTEPIITLEAAERRALAISPDLQAARLLVVAAEVERAAAGVYSNPEVAYDVGNIMVGKGNEEGVHLHPTVFQQLVHDFSITQSWDPWMRRSLRVSAAEQGMVAARLQAHDAVRALLYRVRSAYAAVQREQWEWDLVRGARARYHRTVALSQRRFDAGEISGAELRKVQLEALGYDNDALDATMQLEVARIELAASLAYDSAAEMPAAADLMPPAGMPLNLAALAARALEQRTDVRAAQAALEQTRLEVDAAYRDRLPEVELGVTYERSYFVLSGDNPRSINGHLAVSLPVFDRNQGGIGRAAVAQSQAQVAVRQLRLQVQLEVATAVRQHERAYARRAVFEDQMLDQAEAALALAERTWRAGAVSLLELLEAQRTFLTTRADYLATLYDCQQALIDLRRVVGTVD